MSEDTAVTPPPLKAVFIPASQDPFKHIGSTEASAAPELWVPSPELATFPRGQQGWQELCAKIGATYGETVEVSRKKLGDTLTGSYWIWCDEEARISVHRPQPNPVATSLAGTSHPVLGDALLLNLNTNGDHIDIEDGVLETVQNYANHVRSIIAKCATGTTFPNTGDEL